MATDSVVDQEQQQAEKRLVLSGDPNKAMQQMMDTIDTLRNIYVEENEALQASDTDTFLKIQDKKINAAKDYQSSAEQLMDRKDELQHIDTALKQQLMGKQEEFTGIMAENLKAIDRLRRGVKRLNDRIMNSAREAAQKDHVNYSAQGQIEKNERPVSIGLSESA